jgi:hypothetical protein
MDRFRREATVVVERGALMLVHFVTMRNATMVGGSGR